MIITLQRSPRDDCTEQFPSSCPPYRSWYHLFIFIHLILSGHGDTHDIHPNHAIRVDDNHLRADGKLLKRSLPWAAVERKRKEAFGPIKAEVRLHWFDRASCRSLSVMREASSRSEGLDVELVKTDWDGLRQGLGLGQYDVNHTLLMYLFGPIEGGYDMKITGGIHTGCLRVHVPR